MRRTHATAIALLLGTAGVAGTLAATRTVHLGSSSAQPKLTQRQIVQRSHQLDRFEASLKKSLAQRPPALPAVSFSSTSAPGAAVASPSPLPAAAPVRVVYRRPAPIVIVKHRPGGGHESDDGYEAQGGGSDD
jgi:hypothetical protein